MPQIQKPRSVLKKLAFAKRWFAESLGLGQPSATTLSDAYDSQLVSVMRHHLTPNSTCLDIGANAGEILKNMFRVAPHGRHYAFEPIPHLASDLRQRFPAARVRTCALSDWRGTSEFFHARNAAAESSLRKTHTHSKNPDYEILQVVVETVDDIVPSDEVISLIKIDAEGAEIPIMRGALATIRRCKPLIVFEAGCNTTSAFGITADEIYDCVTDELGMKLSTMKRWIGGAAPFSREQFKASSRIEGEPYFGTPDFDFYFMAY